MKPAPVAKLSSSQRFVLKEMRTRTSVFWLRGCYATTRYALQRRGLIVFNDQRGMYEITSAGNAALDFQLEKEKHER